MLIQVSFTEGFPQVLVEAFGARLPVVATAVGGVPLVAGDAALLVAPGDADAAARALARVVSDVGLRRRLATPARPSHAVRRWRRRAGASRIHSRSFRTGGAILSLKRHRTSTG